MKKSVIIAALIAAAFAVSCNKELSVESEPASNLRTFTCVIADQGSKVGIASDGKTTWEVGDAIHIHTGHIRAGETTTVTLTADDISADGKTATITFEELKPYDYASWGTGYSTYYAAYPASATANPESCYCHNYFSDTNKPLMAAYDDGNGVFVFHNLCGIISFEVSSEFDSYVFTGNSGETVGYDTYAVELLAGASDYGYKKEGPKTSISGSLNASGTNYIGLPDGTNFTNGFTIYFLKGGSITNYVTTNTAKDVARGKILPLGNVSSHLKTYTPPATHNSSISLTDAIDLSAKASANCYLVEDTGGVSALADKVYTFKACKGNTSESVGDVTSVEILWETYNNVETVAANSVVAAVDYDKQAGQVPTIVFKMPSADKIHAGNALIAAKNGAKVLWSWHIWVPQTPVSDISEAIFADKPAMSRNLGALVDTPAEGDAPVESFGMLYQWGRKDPFPGIGSFGHSDPVTLSGSVSFVNEQATTIQQSIENPTVFYWLASKDWQSELSQSSSDSPNAGKLWGEAKKTVYDPCPPGYCMPARASVAFWNGTQLVGQSYFTVNKANYSFTVGSLTFPVSGIIYHSSGKYNKSYTMVWSGRWNSDTVEGYGMYGDIYSDPNSFIRTGKYRCTGGSVRCIKL